MADNKKLKTDCLSPLDIPSLGLPTRGESPHLPSQANCDCHADARACIRVGSLLNKGLGFEDGGKDICMAKLVLPPNQVVWSVSGRGVQKERIVVERGEHGLHAGEVSPSCRDDQHCVQ
jgi:hypothetical protein